jgi:hypothetical protein
MLIKEPEENFACNIVRDISDDAKPLFVPAGELSERNRANIGVHKFDRCAERLTENSDRPLIDFDGDEPCASVAEILGERALPRAYFNDNIVGAQMQAVDNVARNILIAKEILSEGFFWWKHTRKDRVNIQNAGAIFNESVTPLHFGRNSVTFTHVY